MHHYDNLMTEHAAFAFLSQAAREGRPEDLNPCTTLSRRFGNLVTIYGMSGRIAYYRVCKHSSGEEYVRPQANTSEDELFLLVHGG